jgi:hypothetical protein
MYHVQLHIELQSGGHLFPESNIAAHAVPAVSETTELTQSSFLLLSGFV